MLSKNTVNTITLLANRLIAAKNRGYLYCLYVGAGASRVSSGQAAFEYLREQVMCSQEGGNLTPAVWETYSQTKREDEFSRIWRGLGNQEKQWFIRELSQKLCSNEGYQALAEILREGFFRLIITSNADNLLERKLDHVGVSSVKVLYENDIAQSLHTIPSSSTGVTILKLCGDFGVGLSYCVTSQQISDRISNLKNTLKQIPAEGMVMVGFDLPDEWICNFLDSMTPFYFAGKDLPPRDWENFYERFRKKDREDIVDPNLTFESFFDELANQLGLRDEHLFQLLSTDASEPSLIEFLDGQIEDAEAEAIKKSGAPANEEELVEFLQHSVFSVRVDGDRVSFTVSGKIAYQSERSREWDVSVPELNAVAKRLGDEIEAFAKLKDQAGLEGWRERAKREGRHFYKTLVDNHSALGQKFFEAKGSLRSQEILTLSFMGAREHLGLPYELLHDGEAWLATRHPICRQVSGVRPNHSDTLDGTILSLRRENKPLRALLVSSDTGSVPISVDHEVKKLEMMLKHKSGDALKIACDVLLTHQASLYEVEKRLSNCQYHLVHFAGHGDFDPGDPERSGLELFRNEKRKGGVGTLTALKLGQLLRGSEARLFYLSCCVGAAGGDRDLLRRVDYLGVMDALVQAGVPYVLGYRWYVTDAGSLAFAQHFYERLLDSPHVPEHAAWEARKKIYSANGGDETWASPILVAQNVQY